MRLTNIDGDPRRVQLQMSGGDVSAAARAGRGSTKCRPAGPCRSGTLDYVDHACLELLMNWRQHESTGGRLVIDWGELHARFKALGRGKRAARPAMEPEQPTTV
jgi:hypothetical protein